MIIEACQQLAPNRGGVDKPMRVLICGIPNVGKSTLINSLKGTGGETGDEAGVTKQEQRVTLAPDFICMTRRACCGLALSWQRAVTTWQRVARLASPL